MIEGFLMVFVNFEALEILSEAALFCMAGLQIQLLSMKVKVRSKK